MNELVMFRFNANYPFLHLHSPDSDSNVLVPIELQQFPVLIRIAIQYNSIRVMEMHHRFDTKKMKRRFDWIIKFYNLLCYYPVAL
jgi:hypothetical protein